MIEAVFLMTAVGLGCFLVGRISRADREKAGKSQASLRQQAALPLHKEPERPIEPLEPVSPVTQANPAEVRRGAGNRELTPERRAALADIRRQNALDRQHDSRMAATAGLMGVATGAVLMHHHDAEAARVHIDQAAAMQRDAIEQQDHDSGSDLSEFTDEYGVDFDEDWSVDDESDHGDGDTDSQDTTDYDGYEDSGSYDGDDSSDYDNYDGSGGYDDYGSDYDAGQDDGGDGFF